MNLTKKRLLGVLVLAALATGALAVSGSTAADKVSLCHHDKHDDTYWRVDVSVASSAMHIARHGDYLYDGTCDYEPDPS